MKLFFLFTILLLSSSFTYSSTLEKQIKSIETNISGRVGVSILNTQNDSLWSYKGDERFPLMSTFKTLACACLFRESSLGNINLNKEFLIKKSDLIEWSPVTEKLIGNSITLEKACESTMLSSDNTAANIVLEAIGGPKKLTAFLRSIGDQVTILNRIEPELNEAKTGDTRDTTTPNAMVHTLNKILLGNILREKPAIQLRNWMQQNKITKPLIRSVLPNGWFIADRSGSGGNGSRGINAIIWNNSHLPIIITIYITETELSLSERNRVITNIGRLILEEYKVIF